MTTLFLIVTGWGGGGGGGCQSLNELGVASVTKKVVRPKPDQPNRLLWPCHKCSSRCLNRVEETKVLIRSEVVGVAKVANN